MVLSSVIRAASRMGRPTAISHCCRAAMSGTAKDRLYTKKHEWVSVCGDVGTVGISNYAQDALGEVVFVQLPEVGKQFEAGDECGALESVKAASEIYSPVSGTVTEKNEAVESSPSLINKACYGEGWLFRVKLTRPQELERLMDRTAYDAYVQDAAH